MANEGGVDTPKPLETPASSNQVTVEARIAPGISAPREGFLTKLKNLLSSKKTQDVSISEPTQVQMSEQELRDQAAALQAERLNVQAAIKHPDSPLAGKINPQEKLDELNNNIDVLSAKLPPKPTADWTTPTGQQKTDPPSTTDDKAA